MPAKQATRWCGTFWGEAAPEPVDPTKVRYYCWAIETCPTTERVHVQLYFELYKKSTLTGCLGLFDSTGASMHLDVANGSYEENKQYIKGPYTKDGKTKPANDSFREIGYPATQGKRTDLEDVKQALDSGSTYEDVCDEHFSVVARCPRFIKEYSQGLVRKKAKIAAEEAYANVELREWQNEYLEICLGAVDNRAVHWIYDYEGNKGKSFFISFMCAKHQALSLTPARVTDMAYAYDMQKIVLFDLSRTSAPSEDKAHTLDSLYSFIEMLKNGRIFSPKYESVTKTFEPPHVLVFANFPPDQSKLSADRWHIKEI